MKISVNILTKNRKDFFVRAINSVFDQDAKDFEVVVVDDASTDNTSEIIAALKYPNLKIITHKTSKGITQSRQEALEASAGEYIAILDDDDIWVDRKKLSKQLAYFERNPEAVLVGGGIKISKNNITVNKFRPESDKQIRKWILLKNPFFTSTVMFKKNIALKAGGFINDGQDFAEDYDLWLRMGVLGKMFNFKEVFTEYAKPSYNKLKFVSFLKKQQYLIVKHRLDYPKYYYLASLVLNLRSRFGI